METRSNEDCSSLRTLNYATFYLFICFISDLQEAKAGLEDIMPVGVGLTLLATMMTVQGEGVEGDTFLVVGVVVVQIAVVVMVELEERHQML